MYFLGKMLHIFKQTLSLLLLLTNGLPLIFMSGEVFVQQTQSYLHLCLLLDLLPQGSENLKFGLASVLYCAMLDAVKSSNVQVINHGK